MILTRTPLRISFFGGGSDFPNWFLQNGGEVISTTIDKYCYISARKLPPFFNHRHRIVYSKVENVNFHNEIEHPVVRAVLKEMKIDDGIELHHFSDLPARSGLGSSSAFTAGTLLALGNLYGLSKSKLNLSNESINIEQNILKENVGCQDQIAVSFGGFNHISFNRNGEYQVNRLDIELKKLKLLQENILLFFTGVSRLSSEIQLDQVENLSSNKNKISSIQNLVQESLNILQGKQSLDDFGYLLDTTWKIKETLGKKVSNPKIDQIYSEIIKAGALGGKVLGAGGGGFMIFYVQKKNHKNILSLAKELNLVHVPYKFENDGAKVIYKKD